jgi:hypothetical protein
MSTDPNTITDKQQNFINNLLAQREVPAHVARTLQDVPVETLSKQAASEIISALLEAPETTGVQKTGSADDNYGIPSADALPTGRYAIDSADGELTFYRVWRGTRNPDYVKVYLLHGPDETEVPFGKGLVTITKDIAADAAGAAIRYGHEIGACSVCAKRLTNRVSRALGIGPICGGHFYGEEWKSTVHGAREQIKAAGLDPDENVEDDEQVVRYDVRGDYVAPEPVATITRKADIDGNPRMSDILSDLDTRSIVELEGIIAEAQRLIEKRVFAVREQEQERAAYTAKMNRDQTFLGR